MLGDLLYPASQFFHLGAVLFVGRRHVQCQIQAALWWRIAWALTYLFSLPAVTAYLALNFTGSPPFASRSGVKVEIFAYIPALAWMFGIGTVLMFVLPFARL